MTHFAVRVVISSQVRLSWNWLMLVTVGGAVRTTRTMYGTNAHYGSMVMLLAHMLYVNACAKGEHHIPMTWDMFYEKFG